MANSLSLLSELIDLFDTNLTLKFAQPYSRLDDARSEMAVCGYLRQSCVTQMPLCLAPLCTEYYKPCYSLFRVFCDHTISYGTPHITIKSNCISTSIHCLAVPYHALLLTDENGALWCRFRNECNQLGFKAPELMNKDYEELTLNDFFAEQGLRVSYISPTNCLECRHMFVKTGDYEIYAFGNNGNAQCGFKDDSEDEDEDEATDSYWDPPRLIERFVAEKINIVEIRKGDYHSVFLSDRGRLFGCGSNHAFQLGHEDDSVTFAEIVDLSQHLALPSSFVLPVDQIECTDCATFLVDATRKLYAVGLNWHGEFGSSIELGEATHQVTPIDIDVCGTNGKPCTLRQVQCGHGHLCVMDEECRIVTFGANEEGQCGVPRKHERSRENKDVDAVEDWCTAGVVDLPLEHHKRVQSDWRIVCGLRSTYIVDDERNLFVFGHNSFGECLIEGRVPKIWTPTFVSHESIMKRYTQGRRVITYVAGHMEIYIVTE